MEIVQSIESAAHTAVQAIEHPFHTIGARLKAAGDVLVRFFGHPYCAPDLAEALTTLHGVVTDLAQEVAELRVPCPCKPAPTASTTASTTAGTGDAGKATADGAASASEAAPDAHAQANAEQGAMSATDLAEFMQWKAQRAALVNLYAAS